MNGKKCLIVCLAALLALWQPFTVMAAEATAYEDYRSGGLGNVDEGGRLTYTEVHISTEEELAALARDCQVDSWSVDKKIILDADIVLKQEKNLLIPSFGGIFEGNGHRIEEINITKAGSAMGLFRYVQEGGSIRDLTVTGKVNPDGSKSQVGGIVGVNYGRLENCSFSGLVTGDNEVGGIAGVNAAGGTIRRCKSKATVIGNHSTGGIAGNNYGVLNNCSNSGAINIYGTEVTYGLEDITVENLEDINSASNMAAHTDSGGIAGISSGKIYYCANTGTVGYYHVGYNTGGIVGRLSQGYLQNCTNSGHVMGRKDVGGIAGQMEPFLEVRYLGDRLQRLDRETDKLIELMDAAHADLSSCGKSANDAAKSVTYDLKRVNQAGSALSNTSMDLWYIYNQELTGINNDLKALNEELTNLSQEDKEQKKITDANVTNENITNENITNVNVTEVTVSSGNLGEILGDIKDDIKNDDGVGIEKPDGNWNVEIPDDTESYKAALRRFGDSSGAHIDRITSATNERSGGIRDNLQIVNSGLESAGNGLEKLVNILENGTDAVSGDIDAVTEQAKVVRSLISEIRDDLFRYEGIAVEDTSDEAAGGTLSNLGAGEAASKDAEEAYYDTDSFQMGKITRCLNQGLIEADTNVGGIVGQISIEYDLDPEDDITMTGAESFELEQTVKAVVRESRNLGDVAGKKNYVGGIVGKAEHGAVISCESYCSVSGTDGGYVGGIVGESRYAVRSCYFMGELSGKDNVGGISGKGCDIFYSYAYSRIEASGENAGAIAGQVEDAGALYGNYYVAGELGGIDGIGYSGGATPLSYEDFCSHKEVPEAFSDFVITFMADGKELSSIHCRYADVISEEQIPAIPPKEGCYGVWPEYDFSHVTGSRVLEAQYKKWVTSLASEECDKSGRPEILVEGKFYPDTALQVVKGDLQRNEAESDTRAQPADETGAAAEERTDNYSAYKLFLEGQGDLVQPVRVRVLCEAAKGARIEVLSDGKYQPVACEAKGSYLIFDMDALGAFRVVKTDNGGADWKILLAGGVVLIILFLISMKVGKKRKRAKTNKNPAPNKAKAVQESSRPETRD